MISNLEFNYSNTTITVTLAKIVKLVWSQITWRKNIYIEFSATIIVQQHKKNTFKPHTQAIT
jgi:hypothetical protein